MCVAMIMADPVTIYHYKITLIKKLWNITECFTWLYPSIQSIILQTSVYWYWRDLFTFVRDFWRSARRASLLWSSYAVPPMITADLEIDLPRRNHRYDPYLRKSSIEQFKSPEVGSLNFELKVIQWIIIFLFE